MLLNDAAAILVTAGNSGTGSGAGMFALIVCVLFMMERRTILNVTGEAGRFTTASATVLSLCVTRSGASTGTGFIVTRCSRHVAAVSATGGFIAGTVSARRRAGYREVRL